MNALKHIGKVASTVLVGLAVVLALALVGVRLLGFEVYTVLSGSMEPTYKTGSVIWVDKCEASEVEVGDPITFVLNEDLDVATHRVIEIDAENSHFYTQGDANDAPDGSPVHFNNLIGVPVFTVPYLGYFVSYIQNPPGCYVAFIVAAAVLALMFISDFFDKADVRKREEQEAERRERAVARDRRVQRAGAPGSHDVRRSQMQGARMSPQAQGVAQAPRSSRSAVGGQSPRQQVERGQARAVDPSVQTRQRQPRQASQPANSRPAPQARAASRPASAQASVGQANNPRLRQQAYQQQLAAKQDLGGNQ